MTKMSIKVKFKIKFYIHKNTYIYNHQFHYIFAFLINMLLVVFALPIYPIPFMAGIFGFSFLGLSGEVVLTLLKLFLGFRSDLDSEV